MLTRMSPSTFDSMARFTAQIFKTFQWNSVSIFYNEYGLSEVVHKFCFLAVSAIVSELNVIHDIDVNIEFIDNDNMEDMLKEKVGSEYSSKSKIMYFFVTMHYIFSLHTLARSYNAECNDH